MSSDRTGRRPRPDASTPPAPSPHRQPIIRTPSAHIPPATAVGSWIAAWLVGQVLTVIIFVTSGNDVDDASLGVLLAATATTWALYLVALQVVSDRWGTGGFRSDYGLSFRVTDLLGLPGGVVLQVAIVPLIYLPLRAWWPDTFGNDQVQENANRLADQSSGVGVLVLVAMIAIGAPFVEELVYRGLIQRSLAGRFTATVAWLTTAALFTAIHFRPVEYPGLAVFSLAVGAAALLTDRLGLPIALHVGFNATGLVMAFQ